MDGSDWKDTPLLGRLEVLENLDAQSRVLKGMVSPNGAAHTVSMIVPLCCLQPRLQRQCMTSDYMHSPYRAAHCECYCPFPALHYSAPPYAAPPYPAPPYPAVLSSA